MHPVRQRRAFAPIGVFHAIGEEPAETVIEPMLETGEGFGKSEEEGAHVIAGCDLDAARASIIAHTKALFVTLCEGSQGTVEATG